jgi:hypothetical protein
VNIVSFIAYEILKFKGQISQIANAYEKLTKKDKWRSHQLFLAVLL